VDKTKWTIVGVAIVALAALILVTVLASVIRTIIDLAIVVGAVYLIARVVMKKK
jgi:type IV secretory pathway VirB3-like protein